MAFYNVRGDITATNYTTFIKKIHLNSRNKQVFGRIIFSGGGFLDEIDRNKLFYEFPVYFSFYQLDSLSTFLPFDRVKTYSIGSVLHIQN